MFLDFYECDSFVNYQRKQYWSVKIGIVFIGLWCNGNTTVFGAVVPGSNPGSPTIILFRYIQPTWSVKIVWNSISFHS